MERKRIIILQTGHIITDQRIQKISKYLAFDHEVEIFYRNYLKNNSPLPKNFKLDNIKLHPINTLFKNGFLFYLEINIKYFLKLIFKKFNVLYSVDSDTLLSATFLKILKKISLIFDAHEYFEEVPELENKPIKKIIWNKITNFGLRFSNINMTVSESLKNEFKFYYKKDFIVLRNIPEFTELNSVIEKFEVPTIIYQGALNKGRHLELLINTMKKLPQFNCLIIGEGDLTLSLKNIADHSPNIKFLGLHSPTELKDITPKCHLGYNLLEPIGKSYQMSLSNKYFDYLHAGIPSISSNLIEYQSLNNQFGIGICINENELETYINSLLNLESKYMEMIENIKKYKSELTWQKEFEKFKTKLKEIN